jgi:hypothetical protein
MFHFEIFNSYGGRAVPLYTWCAYYAMKLYGRVSGGCVAPLSFVSFSRDGAEWVAAWFTLGKQFQVPPR